MFRSGMLVALGGLVLCSSLRAQTLTTTQAAGSSTCKTLDGDVCFSFFADGNVRKAIDKKEGASPTSGAIGVGMASKRWIFSGQINIADKPDTITRGYGASLVTPGVGGALSAGLIDYRFLPEPAKDKYTHGLGFHTYASIASSRWATTKDTVGKTLGTTDAAIVGLGAHATWVVASGKVSENPVFIALDGGFAYRQLFGDIATGANNSLKQTLYGTKKEIFVGEEIGLTMQINALKAGLNYYFFHGGAQGLTDGQVVFGFSIQSNVFVGKLTN